jgi:HK97 family phage portal protein
VGAIQSFAQSVIGRYWRGDDTRKPPSFWPITWWQQGFRIPATGRNAVVEACIGAITQTVAMLPIGHWRENDRGGSDRVKNSAASRVLRRPNGYQTKADFFLNLVRAELVTGNGYALAERNNRNEISGLHLMRPNNTTPYINPEDGSVYYTFPQDPIAPGADPVVGDFYPARDVLHIRMHTPVSPLVGESPMLAAAYAIDSGNAIQEAMAAFHKNMARPSGYLKTPGTLKPEMVEVLRTEWQSAYQGVNSGRAAVLQNGVEWQALSMNAVDAAVVESYKMSVADIARVFRTPLPIIGEIGGQTYNNTEVLMKNWLATGLGYVLEHIELALDFLFQLPEGEWIAFDADYLLRADFAARIEGIVKGIQGGLFSPNEGRAREGLPSVKFGDEPRVQAQVVPLSFASKPPETAPSAPAANPPGGAKQTPPPDNKKEEEQEGENMSAEELENLVAEVWA